MLRALPLPVGELLPDMALDQFQIPPSCFLSPTSGQAVLGAVWGAAEVLGVWQSVPVYSLCTGCCGLRGESRVLGSGSMPSPAHPVTS